MTATVLTSYLGQGLIAARPATPAIATGTVGFYYATDTAALSIYANGAWAAVGGGGGGAGTPPTVVQSAASNAGTQSVVMGVAPTNGNLLVAMCFNPAVDTAGTGWTNAAENSSGTDYGTIMTKTAGAAESTTQSPLASSPGGTGCIVIWELHKSAGTPTFFTASLQTEQSSLAGTSGAFPNLQNFICLGAVGLVSGSNNVNALYNMTQDQKLNTGTGRQIIAGHSDLGSAAIGQLLATFTGTGTPSNKAFIALFQ